MFIDHLCFVGISYGEIFLPYIEKHLFLAIYTLWQTNIDVQEPPFVDHFPKRKPWVKSWGFSTSQNAKKVWKNPTFAATQVSFCSLGPLDACLMDASGCSERLEPGGSCECHGARDF